jgi:hypothetical protein
MPIASLILIFPFVLLAAIVWAIVGTFFWIPLLAKSVTIFTFSIVTHAIVNRPVSAAAMNLDKAIRYYINGFIIIFRSMDIDQPNGYPAGQQETEHSSSLIGAIISNLAMIFQEVLF